jgi:polar amino acid transport system substrate-binding protein
MKRYSMMTLAILLAGFLLAACGEKSAPTKVRMGTAASYPPFESVDYDQRQLTGFDIELMKAIAAKANLDVEFVNVSYDQVLAGMVQCQYDGAISAIPITDDLKQQMIFSEPYFAAGQVVVVKKGNSLVTGRDTLTGMTVGLQKGTSSAAETEKIAGVKLKSYDTFNLAFQDLIIGELDAVVADKMMALSYVNKAANNLKIVGDEFAIENYGIAVCKTNADLLKKIDDGLVIVKNNGTLAKLNQKWLANPIVE